MKVYSIIAEEKQIDELNLRLTKKDRALKRADKATKGSLKDEVKNLEIELLTYMKNSGNKTATPDLVKNYLKQKGLGSVGDQVVDQVAATNAGPAPVGMDNPRQEPPVTRGTPPAPGAAPATPQVPPPAGQPNASIPTGTISTTNGGEEFKFLGAQWRSTQSGRMANKAQKAELVANANKQTNSMYEAADGVTLSKRQVRNILSQVITKAYGQSAGFSKSKFATDTASGGGNDAEAQAMIDKLKSMGYKVSK